MLCRQSRMRLWERLLLRQEGKLCLRRSVCLCGQGGLRLLRKLPVPSASQATENRAFDGIPRVGAELWDHAAEPLLSAASTSTHFFAADDALGMDAAPAAAAAHGGAASADDNVRHRISCDAVPRHAAAAARGIFRITCAAGGAGGGGSMTG